MRAPSYIDPASPPPLDAPWLRVNVDGEVYRPHLARIRKRWFTTDEIRKLDIKTHTHTHCIYHLIYYLEGSISVQVDGEIIEVSAGQVLLIDPDVYHNIIPREPKDCCFLTLMFTYQCGEKLLPIPFNELLEHLVGFPARIPPVIDDSQGTLHPYYATLEKEVLSCDPDDLKRVGYCLSGIFNELAGMALRRKNVRSIPDDILETQRFILLNLDQSITIETLKEISNLSRSQLIGKFKQYCGMSPIDFLIHERIEKSKTYLLHSSRRIKEIAWMCGFQSEYYFCKTFKKRTGLTPGQFRNGGAGQSY